MLNRARNRYPFRETQTHFPLTEAGIADAVASAREMRCVKATVVPRADLL
jgi:hypothetical protein